MKKIKPKKSFLSPLRTYEIKSANVIHQIECTAYYWNEGDYFTFVIEFTDDDDIKVAEIKSPEYIILLGNLTSELAECFSLGEKNPQRSGSGETL